MLESKFSWVDFAGENKRKMLNVVKLFHEREARDELGIGVMRNRFSDYFFPGTSTIQTRAKYMLLIPWIYKELERKQVKYPKIVYRARRKEIKLIYALLKSQDTEGLIGSEAKDKLARLPSEIYWTGLYSWGIRKFPGYQSQYHRSLTENYYKKQRLSRETFRENWDPGLPKPPENIMEYANFNLLQEEAEYLLERISSCHRRTLLYYLLNAQLKIDADFFWELPLIKTLPNDLQDNIKHCRNFSETIHGASLLYNFLLSRQCKNEKWIAKYRDELKTWTNSILKRWSDLTQWHSKQKEFWGCEAFNENRIHPNTQKFVKNWYEIIFSKKKLKSITKNTNAAKLIKERERQLKKKRARLWNPRAREMWRGASGTSQLDYRWSNVKKIISDILNGLDKGK